MSKMTTLEILNVALELLAKKELAGDPDPAITGTEVYTACRAKGRHPEVLRIRATLINNLHKTHVDNPDTVLGGYDVYRLPR